MKNNEERVKSIMKKVESRKRQRGEILTTTALGLCAFIGLIFSTKLNGNILDINMVKNNSSGDLNGKEFAYIDEIELPTFSSKQEILDKLQVDDNGNRYLLGDMVIYEDFNSSVDNAVATGNAPSSVVNGEMKQELSKEHSSTNVQVQGVDEGDIVKTNGNFVYYIKNNKLYIFETKTTKTKLVKTIEIGKEHDLFAQEMYIDDNYITVITQEYIDRGNVEILKEVDKADNSGDNTLENLSNSDNIDNSNKLVEEEENNSAEKILTKIYPDYSTTVTSMYIYDINSYELVKNVKTEGTYVSSRKINNNVYMVTNRYLYSYRINEDNVLPIYSENSKEVETKEDSVYKEIPANCIRYFPNIEKECNYMIITSINLSEMDKQANVESYLGAGTEIYCSKENLYVARVERPYRYFGFATIASDSLIEIDGEIESKTAIEEKNKTVTKLHKFKLLDGVVKYVATGEVEGALLNQYSMDENNGYFRITTTSEKGNSLYVLDKELKLTGKLENLAKGEKIYATRFMGDKCYMVTYKTVDPLYVIDLSNPENPTVLGELKLPGYSTYLHPLGENYLIGFGEDSIEKNYIDWQGNSQVTAYNIGLKLAIFDVSDLENPKEIHSVKIGGRGSSSDLLHNPKSLYYDVEKGIFAFPATLYEETKYYEDGTPRYGEIVFRGALIYDLSVDDGIELRGKIQHEGTKKSGSNIERIISIGENFYTISPEMVKVTEIETMKEIEEGTCKF